MKTNKRRVTRPRPAPGWPVTALPLRGDPATIRADRYEPLQTAPQLAGVLQSVLFVELKAMPPAGFKEVITGPPRRATASGQRLSIEPLIERLLADSAGGADALPLLALTLARL